MKMSEWGLVNKVWSDHIPGLGGIDEGWPDSLLGVCDQCCARIQVVCRIG